MNTSDIILILILLLIMILITATTVKKEEQTTICVDNVMYFKDTMTPQYTPNNKIATCYMKNESQSTINKGSK